MKSNKPIKVLFLIFSGTFTLLLILFYPLLLDGWKLWKASRKINREIEVTKRLYRQDIYGGKTPEETLDLFIKALESGNLDLAAKYFVLEKQDEARAMLQEVKEIKNILDTLKEARMNWKRDTTIIPSDTYVRFVYKSSTNKESKAFINMNGKLLPTSVPAGTLEESFIDFRLNPESKVWKIVAL